MKKYLPITVLMILLITSCSKSRETNIPLTAINVNNALSLKIGSSQEIAYTLTPSNTYDSVITWTSSDPEIAEVNGSVIHALKKGTCTVTGKSNGGIRASISVAVSNIEIESIKLNTASTEVYLGESVNVTIQVLPANATDKTLVFESSDQNIVEVGEYSFYAKNVGEATVTVKNKSGTVSSSLNITVKPRLVTEIILNKAILLLETGDNEIVTAAVNSNATNKQLVWSSENESVATVDQQGRILGVSVGHTHITIKSADGNTTARIPVTVAKTEGLVFGKAGFMFISRQDSYTWGVDAIVINYSKNTFTVRRAEIDDNNGTVLISDSPPFLRTTQVLSGAAQTTIASHSQIVQGSLNLGSWPPSVTIRVYLENNSNGKKYLASATGNAIHQTHEVYNIPN